MKKTLSVVLSALLCLLLCACGVQPPVTLADALDLPPDGVVSAQTLSQLGAQRQVMTLRGETDGVPYTWALFGTEISAPEDCCFALSHIRVGQRRIKVAFASTRGFGFAPLLTLLLPKALDADVAAVYRTAVREENYLCAASVTVHENGGAVSFPVADPTDVLWIVPVKNDTAPTPKASDGPEPETAAPQPDETTVPAAATAIPTTEAQTEETTTAAAQTKPTAQTTTQSTTIATTAAATTTTAPPTETAAPQTLTCTFSAECGTVLQHLEELEPGRLDILPPDGVLLAPQSVTFTEGESVFDVLQRVCRDNGIPMEASYVPLYGSAYVEGIGNLYEFDCGEGSGWMYRVNGSYPSFGCSRYALRQGDRVEFRYTCDLGADIGGRNDFTS